ncbi:transport protein [Lactobacillus amylovorus]|uniref:Transport protein n=1 Tax=Lactobacillus amylovorus TaxID=1604 RepID=F0TGU1_LACAM|nr:MFS transporter [Lactobacillus amylovorus]ADZ07935.1 transport protein [Lactobacillus amylovorus]
MKADVNKLSFKLAILSISLFCASGFSISAAIPNIKTGLGNVSLTNIEVLVSIPTFGLIFGLLLSWLLIKRYGYKNTVITGLIIMTIFGTFPLINSNYVLILISRFCLGIGIGVFNSLCFSLISEYYTGQLRAKMIGLQSATQALGSTILTLLVGILIPCGWHYVFLIYLLNIFPLILFAKYVPDDRVTSRSQRYFSSLKNAKIFIIAVFACIYFITELTITYKCSSFIVSRGIGSSSQAAIILALNTMIGFVSGILFSRAFKCLGNYIVSISLLSLGILFCLVNIVNSLYLVGLIVLLCGFFASWVSSYLYNSIAGIGDYQTQPLINTVLIIGVNIGCFMNPYLNDLIGNLLGTNNAGTLICFSGIILLICSAMTIVFMLIKKVSH